MGVVVPVTRYPREIDRDTAKCALRRTRDRSGLDRHEWCFSSRDHVDAFVLPIARTRCTPRIGEGRRRVHGTCLPFRNNRRRCWRMCGRCGGRLGSCGLDRCGRRFIAGGRGGGGRRNRGVPGPKPQSSTSLAELPPLRPDARSRYAAGAPPQPFDASQSPASRRQ